MCGMRWFTTDHHRESKGGSLSAGRWSLDITVHSPKCWDSSPPRFDDDKQPRKDGRHPTRPLQRTGLEKGFQGGADYLPSEDCLVVNEHSHCLLKANIHFPTSRNTTYPVETTSATTATLAETSQFSAVIIENGKKGKGWIWGRPKASWTQEAREKVQRAESNQDSRL